MTELYVWLQTQAHLLRERAEDENGATSVEYAGLVMAVAFLLLTIAGILSERGNDIGNALADVVKGWIEGFGA
jgi:Flp pilus assembly pilin Flp